eukprot:COSAG06_NODE_12417_length_1384_cov_39.101167_2_plen_54_part_00
MCVCVCVCLQLAVNLMALQSAREVRLLRGDVRTLWRALYGLSGLVLGMLLMLF